MNSFSQQNSPLKVFTSLAENSLLAIKLSGEEKLGDSFEFAIDLIAAKTAPISASALVGNDACVILTMPDSVVRYYHGEVSEFSQSDSDEVFDVYSMVLKPRLARLALTRQSRVFQNQTSVDVIKVVLTPVGGADFQIAGAPPIRDYCAQYRETDLDFFLRICSEEGFTHYWKHSQDNHELVVTDNSPNAPSLGEIDYDQTVGGTAGRPFIRSWKMTQRMNTTQVALLDSHFQLFRQRLEGTANGPATINAGTVPLNPVGSHAPWQEDGHSAARYFDGVTSSGEPDSNQTSNIYPAQERQARILAAGAASKAVGAVLVGNCCQLTPGHAFTLTGHPNQNGSWIVQAARHEISVEGRFWAGDISTIQCAIRAEAAPLDLVQAPWPPKLRPKVGGVETALVTGPSGGETFTDMYGRIKVRFWFDRTGPTDGGSSCWVRVAQVWAGNSWGACFWPRVGHEVVVSFEGGDPDRPIVVGSVYNATNMPPFPMPQSVYISGWKSLTEGGDPTKNFHQILMSDEKGAEIVHIHAESMFIAHQETQQISKKPNLDVNFQG